jgi:hypothetical protein
LDDNGLELSSLSMGNGQATRKPATRNLSTFSGLAMHIESGACGKGMCQWVLSEINEKLKAVGWYMRDSSGDMIR